jgi:alpha(1,3/1,4) fucosyltransferase
MKNKIILFRSGWLMNSHLREFYREDDGRSDFIVKLIEQCKNQFRVITNLHQLDPSEEVCLEIHINAQLAQTKAPKILLYLECPEIRPQNIIANFKAYNKIISWFHVAGVDDKKMVILPYPHKIKIENHNFNFYQRKIHYSMLCSNRNVFYNGTKSIYNKRVDVINHVISNLRLTDKFKLYGLGWNKRPVCNNVFSMGMSKIKYFNKLFMTEKYLNIWQGIHAEKKSVLLNSRFNFCYENVDGLNGYISEKLLDALSCYTVPVYYSSFDIKNIIPADLYFDARKYPNIDSLFADLAKFDNNSYDIWKDKVKEILPILKKRHSIENFLSHMKLIINEQQL